MVLPRKFNIAISVDALQWLMPLADEVMEKLARYPAQQAIFINGLQTIFETLERQKVLQRETRIIDVPKLMGRARDVYMREYLRVGLRSDLIEVALASVKVEVAPVVVDERPRAVPRRPVVPDILGEIRRRKAARGER